jgi:MoxR-like ATPase
LSISQLKRSPAEDARAQIAAVIEQGSKIVLGKERELRLSVACLLARGHLLIEDLPGVGKTTLAQLLARLIGSSFQRIQFTSDMLPADIVGVSVYDRNSGEFVFHRGPIFAQLVLADEVNRATPRAQSALLEAMEERQVTVEGETYPLPTPFFVIATQNPSHQVGTYPLPESQLDRFLMRISIGFPPRDAERDLLEGEDRRLLLARLAPVIDDQTLHGLQKRVESIHVAGALLDYVQNILTYSRQTPTFAPGLSPRAGLALLRSAKAWALMNGRDHALPEDIQTVLPSVVSHRLRSREGEGNGRVPVDALIDAIAIP